MADSRNALKKLMTETVADEETHHDWTYRAVRPLYIPSSWKPGQPVVGDCSWGVKLLCRWAGAPDPMGTGYSGYGNSQTLWSHLQHLAAPDELQIGDVVTFGFDGDKHAAMVYTPGVDPILWSFGHQGAPEFYRLSADHRPAQYLRNPLPAYVPTPIERLREMTGWFAWVAWRLGEGDWRPYGKTNPVVRPNVPKVIPPSWWVRLAKFLAARNQGNPPRPRGV